MPAPLSRPECTLPKRSHHVLPIKPLPSVPGLPGYYSNRNSELHAHSEQQVRLRRPSPGRLDDDGTNGSITSNVIHNLPLPPGPGGAQLIRTLQLDRILKSKWISGIAVTKKNEYIVVDQREAYLLDEEGTLKKLIGAKGSNKLIEPFNVCVNPSNGNLVICDHADQDIKIFTWKGQFLKRVKDPALTNIAGVAVTDSKDIVIAGTDKQRVSVLADDGRLSYTIPSMTDGAARNKNRTPFEHPYSLAVNPLTGDIIIGDDYKQLVTAVSPSRDGQDPRVMWRYCPGPGDRHFFPSSICVDPKGYIFIADLYNEKVYMLDSSGKFVKTLLSRGDGLKGGPGAIAADGRGHLLVADEEKVIKVFKYRDENGFAINKRYSYCPQAT
jgi:DNA-binding beta-propeller fold protein YncE